MNSLDLNLQLEVQMNKLKISEDLNAQEPKKRPNKNELSLVLQFNDKIKTMKETSFSQSYIIGNSHCSRKQLSELKPIRLRKMKVPHLHSGRYLLCRTTSQATCMVGIMVIVQDLDGNIEVLEMYNCINNLNMDLNEYIPEGTILIIKEPFLKYHTNDRTTLICCTSPSDVLFVDETDPVLANTNWFVKYDQTEFNAFKEQGNDFFKQAKYASALRFYMKALSIDKTHIIHSNIAAALIKLGRYQEAYDHAKKSFDLEPSDKALFRMGQTAYELRQWTLALDNFTLIKDLNLSREYVKKCMKRLDEAKSGNYDWLHMLEQSKDAEAPRLDVADYVGPVEIGNVPGKNKGLIASRDIGKGELLLVSKAFSSAFSSECGFLFHSLNKHTREINSNTQGLNMINTMINLKNNPNAANDVYSLYCGSSDRDETVPACGIIDTNRIEQIDLLNAFVGENTENFAENDCESNLFQPKITGLWILPSYINHSCHVNAYRTFYGDIMAVHSIQNIRMNDEITMQYIDVSSMSYRKRNQQLNESYKFTCKCNLCLADESDEQYECRERLIQTFYACDTRSLKEIFDFVDELKSLFAKRDKLRFQLIQPLNTLAQVLCTKRNYEEAIYTLEEIYEITNCKLEHISLTTLYKMAALYYQLNDMMSTRTKLIEAVHKSKVMHGDCLQAFKIRFRNLPLAKELFELI